MQKKDLLNRVAKKTDLPIVDLHVAFDAINKVIMEVMTEGEDIFIRGFGTYAVIKRAPKLARNIKANCEVRIPARYKAAFKPAGEFAAIMKSIPVK